MVEQLTCNQQVEGSIPFASSMFLGFCYKNLPMGRLQSGQMQRTVNPSTFVFDGSNPSLPTNDFMTLAYASFLFFSNISIFLLIFVDFDCFVVYNHKYAVLGILSFSNNKIFIVKCMMLYISYTKFAIGVCVVGVLRKIYSQIYIKWRLPILYSLFALYVFCMLELLTTLKLIGCWKNVINICVACVAVLLGIYALIDYITKRLKLTPFVAFASLCAVICSVCGWTTYLLFLMLFLIVFKGCSFKTIVKVFSGVMLFGLLLNVFLGSCGMISNNDAFNRGGRVRYALGFNNPNNIMMHYFVLCASLNYLYVDKKQFIYLLFAEAILNCLLVYYTISRTGFLLFWVLFAVSLIAYLIRCKFMVNFFAKNKFCQRVKNWFLRDRVNKIFSIILALLPWIYAFSFGLLVILWGYGVSFAEKINDLLSGRIGLVYEAFCNYGLTPFGAKIDWRPAPGVYVGLDSSFYHHLFNNGLVPTFVFWTLASYIFYKLGRNKKYFLSALLIVVLLYSTSEAIFLKVHLNVFLLVLIEQNIGGKLLYGESKPIEIEEKSSAEPDKQISPINESNVENLCVGNLHNVDYYLKRKNDYGY